MKHIIRELQDKGNRELAAKVKKVLAGGSTSKIDLSHLPMREKQEIINDFTDDTFKIVSPFISKTIAGLEKGAKKLEKEYGVYKGYEKVLPGSGTMLNRLYQEFKFLLGENIR